MYLQPVANRQADLTRRFPSWQRRTMHAILDETASLFPERDFVISAGSCLSYSEVSLQSRKIAAGLGELGVGLGDRVALVMGNFAEFVPLKYAISRLGAIAVPVNILLKADELRYVLAQSESKLLVTMDSFRGLDHLAILDKIIPGWARTGGGSELPSLQKIVVFRTGEVDPREGIIDFSSLSETCERDLTEVAPDCISDILYTSGTTGSPKGVQLTHDMLMRTAFGSAYARGFEDGHRIIFALPLFHVFGFVEGLLSVPFVGGAIIPQAKFDPVDMLREIEQSRPSDALLIPAMSLALIDALKSQSFDCSSLHFALASGGKAPPRLWSELRKSLGISEITTGYGMTETTASTTVTRPDDPEERLLSTNGRLRQIGPAADPELDGILVDYRVVDPETGKILPPGEMGELQARGIGVTSGYYKKPKETADAFTADGWLHTGDLGTLDKDKYVTLIGRTKESYRCGGEQVLPSEVEDVMGTFDGVKQVHVAPLPDERMGEVGVAFIVPADGAELSEDSIIRAAAEKLARFKVPRHVLFVEEQEIPLTASGRAKKFELTYLASERLGVR